MQLQRNAQTLLARHAPIPFYLFVQCVRGIHFGGTMENYAKRLSKSR